MRYLSFFVLIPFVASVGTGPAKADRCTSHAGRLDQEKVFNVEFDDQNAVVGEPLRVTWVAPRDTKISSPQYLIIAAPDTVRFAKGQFFALRPNAPAPLNASFGNSLTRVIIPLDSVGTARGEFQIVPFLAGDLTITWSIVAPADCPSSSLIEPQRKTISVKSGPAVLAVKEDFPLRLPLEVRRSNNGAYELSIFKNSFHVVDVSSGEMIFVPTEGKNPTFSPTSRFLLHETLGEQTVEITDLVSGNQIFRGMSTAVAFTLEDSFAIIAHWWHGMTLLRTLQDTATLDAAEIADKPDESMIPLGDSLGDRRFGGSDGSFSGQRAFRLSLDTGTIAYQEQYAGGVSYAETAVEVRDLATGKVIDPLSNLSQNEAKKFTSRTPRNREIHGWFSGHKVSLIFKRPHQLEGASLAITSRAVSALQSKARRLIAENSTGQRRGTTVGGRPAPGTASSFSDRMNEFVGIARYEAKTAIRTSANKKLAQDLERELSRVYDPKIAKFGYDKIYSYDAEPFPDPTPESPNRQHAPVQIDLSKEGYVIWRWTRGGTRYWFQQTVQAGRRARSFSYNLLAWDGKEARRIDLQESARLYQETLASPISELNTVEMGDFRSELDSAIHDPAVVTTIDDRFVAFVPKPSEWLFVFDFKSWKPHCLIEASNAGLTSWVTLSRDLNSVLQFNVNGTFSIYSCKTGDTVLTGAYLDDELIAMDPSGYFEGSYEAETLIQLTIPGIPGKHFLRQYASKLRRPGLVAQALAGNALEAPDLRAPPMLTIVDEKQGDSRWAVRLSAEGPVPLKELQIFGDGMLFRTIRLSGQKASQRLPLSELGAYRTITAIAVDSEGVASTSVPLKSNDLSSNKQRTLFAIATGINDYQDKQLLKLRYASSDAQRVLESLRYARGYTRVSRSVIPRREANVRNILAAIRRIAQSAASTDTILFFFSGHGLEAPDGTLFLALPETDTTNLSSTALRWDDIAAALASSKARVVVLLDACHSGLSDRMQTTNDQAVSRLISKSGTPMIIFSASKGRQYSEESATAGGGHFSSAFARIVGKERDAFDVNKNGAIEVDELYQGLKQSVARSTNGRQTPWLSRNELRGSFALF